jgi:DNA repair protein RecN (Recombination protein N)
VAEITGANLVDPNEIDTLFGEIALLESARELNALLAAGIDALDETEAGPRPALVALLDGLEGLTGLEEPREAVTAALVHLDEAASTLHRTLGRVEEDPARLAELNERLSLLNELCRRYGPTLADVVAKGEELATQLERLDAAEGRREVLDELLVAAQAEVETLEASVRAARATAAPKMAGEIEARLATLALERASITLSCEGPAGEEVELCFSANPGLAPQPVAKVASGGELARLMLAVHLSMPGGPPTMVFDEVDAGVGGATAITLARALKDLAADQQVIVVTHLAQVAAAADTQVVVTKDSTAEATIAQAHSVEGAQRVAEIARMLSGHPDSDSARSHAAELLGSF